MYPREVSEVVEVYGGVMFLNKLLTRLLFRKKEVAWSGDTFIRSALYNLLLHWLRHGPNVTAYCRISRGFLRDWGLVTANRTHVFHHSCFQNIADWTICLAVGLETKDPTTLTQYQTRVHQYPLHIFPHIQTPCSTMGIVLAMIKT